MPREKIDYTFYFNLLSNKNPSHSITLCTICQNFNGHLNMDIKRSSPSAKVVRKSSEDDVGVNVGVGVGLPRKPNSRLSSFFHNSRTKVISM